MQDEGIQAVISNSLLPHCVILAATLGGVGMTRRGPEAERRLRERLEDRLRAWNVAIEELSETETSIIAFGTRHEQPVVLKVLRESAADEWRSGEVLNAFGGRGVVQVYEHTAGAVLLERLVPGNALSGLVLDGHDEEATQILTEVLRQMDAEPSLQGCVAVETWARGFSRYLESGDDQIPRDLVENACDLYLGLCGSQGRPRLLHGDLHHDNVLFDEKRGWLAIDPKGVIGELEYEVGAAMRNPVQAADLFVAPQIVRSRIDKFEKNLKLNARRVLEWTFAQAVLSAIWSWEDGFPIGTRHPSLMLARTIRLMIDEG
jgi:streptomycin 6-kinase